MTFLTLIFLTFAIVVIINISIWMKFWQIIEVATGINLDKPFNCPLCCTFWVTLGFVIFTEPTLPLILSAFFFGYVADFLDKLYNTY